MRLSVCFTWCTCIVVACVCVSDFKGFADVLVLFLYSKRLSYYYKLACKLRRVNPHGKLTSAKSSVKLQQYSLPWGGQDRYVPNLVTIYKSLILPHLDYCSAVWGCIGNGLNPKLENLQNRAARIITGSLLFRPCCLSEFTLAEPLIILIDLIVRFPESDPQTSKHGQLQMQKNTHSSEDWTCSSYKTNTQNNF